MLVHDVHAWTITKGYDALTLHVLIDPEHASVGKRNVAVSLTGYPVIAPPERPPKRRPGGPGGPEPRRVQHQGPRERGCLGQSLAVHPDWGAKARGPGADRRCRRVRDCPREFRRRHPHAWSYRHARKEPQAYDACLYRERHLVECFINKSKPLDTVPGLYRCPHLVTMKWPSKIREVSYDRFGLRHVTIQVERSAADCAENHHVGHLWARSRVEV